MEAIQKMFMTGYSTEEITVLTVITCFLITLLISSYIYFVYKISTRKSFYNKDFNISVIIIALITSGIILTIQSNIVVSLGMVGALSIVRFRTAIKNPLDLAFLYWSISVGIICGAGFPLIAVIVSIFITIIIILFMNVKLVNDNFLLVVDAGDYMKEKDILKIVEDNTKYMKVRARNASQNGLNIAIEVMGMNDNLILKLMDIDTVTNASVVQHDGNVTV